MLDHPISIYINWSAYDELSDTVELTEDLAMRQLDELLRLRSLDCRFDYYLMDAFWYASDGGYRTWRKPHWPDGPDRWLDKCLTNGVKPGLWVATNNLFRLDPQPEWRDSLNRDKWAACMFHGGFLPHFVETLAMWYERGVRMFKFDFAALDVATPELEEALLPSEIRAMNSAALRAALKTLKAKHPDLMFLAYNGFEEIGTQGDTSQPPRKSMDPRWLEAFDAMYCGDPRPSDVPARNFWRSKDVYSDHMVRHYARQGLPSQRIDNSGFMIGKTGTCYHRGKAAWKGMLLLSLMRGGWANTYYGNLELLTDEDARWFAKAQSLLMPLQAHGVVRTLGPMPGEGQPYRFMLVDDGGSVVAVVNPGQTHQKVDCPRGRVLWHDAGFEPVLDGRTIELAPEQMALVGFGPYDSVEFDLGISDDWPVASHSMELAIQDGRCTVPPGFGLRLTAVAKGSNDRPHRLSGGSLPNGKSTGNVLTMGLYQRGKPLSASREDNKVIWSGIAWGVVEVAASEIQEGIPVEVRCLTKDPAVKTMEIRAYAVKGA